MRDRRKIQVFLAFLLLVSFAQSKAQQKPNIVVLFADDISAREIPIYGSKVWSRPIKGGDEGRKQNINTSNPKFRAQTPNMDKLAQEGCFIETTFAATICGPSRAMMMTGRYAHLHKWWHNKDKGKNPKGKREWNLFDSSPHTISHVAKKGGYDTYWAGKTQMETKGFQFDEGCFTAPKAAYNKRIHTTDFMVYSKKVDGKKKLFNGDTDKELGFRSYVQASWFWKPHIQLLNHPNNTEELQWWPYSKEDKKAFGLNTYSPDVVLDHIFDFMERKTKKKKPFFIYHTSNLGHDAFDYFHPESNNKWPGTPKIKWDGKKYTRTKTNITGDNGVYDTHNTITGQGIHNHINYLDYQVWQYMNKFKELGIENNTIFIFCADNATSGYGKSSSVSQKGVHVPLIIYAPVLNMTKKGKQKVIANISDILPTIADVAGVEIPKDYEINGESLIPFLTTKKTTHRNWIYGYHKDKTIIRGDLVLKGGNGKWYDVSKTPDDLISYPIITDWKSVSDAHRKQRDELKKVLPKYDLHATEHDAPKGGYGEVKKLEIKGNR
ncbi:arylsulfatase A-like enzyme [Wenyingzhuangia heitensis]|uniref:Arylsulfatase A-like enzyme n=1 Tax=Wenyingzhuangia heitensis TaxID=1487859 RepID=A0ABX0UAN1_9FLAO|nr:sulfatase-like hydrolase/transferase [Wenyingzhuangia heitensis]NIJ44890.1 arylsulfatase A-like enzyme [Wenyingzhuangia heitensis]